MEPDRHCEVDDLYRQAQNIFMHEMTEDEQRFVSELGFESPAALPPDKVSLLKELVRNKEHVHRGPLEAAPDTMVIVDKEKITLHRVLKTPKVIRSIRCHKCQLMCRDGEHYLDHGCAARLALPIAQRFKE